MFKAILVRLDGSDVAEVVLPVAREMGKALGAKGNLVSVVDIAAITRSIVSASNDMGAITTEIQGIIDDSTKAELQQAEAYFNEAAKAFTADDVEVSTRVRQGRCWGRAAGGYRRGARGRCRSGDARALRLQPDDLRQRCRSAHPGVGQAGSRYQGEVIQART